MKSEFSGKRLRFLFVLFVAIIFFLLSLLTGQTILDVPVLFLGFYLHKYGSPVLLKSYNERRKKHLVRSIMIQGTLRNEIEEKRTKKMKKREEKNV